MKQIIEDYVSYEIAVLLKEKKFGWKCNTAYLELEDGRVELRCEDKAFYQEQTKRRYCVPALLAPSLYNAMKWLREVHKCYIHICPFYLDLKYNEPPKWLVAVDYNCEGYPTLPKHFDSYEEAVEAAILYVLKNLI